MRVIALDVGEKSCGVALSDPLKIIAQGKENIRFEKSRDWDYLISYLNEAYFKEVDTIVIGYPTLPSGDKSKTTLMVEEFKELLSTKVKQKIVFEDEFLTSKRSNELMIESNLSRKKRKEIKDQAAAVLILQSYLERI